MDVVRRVDARAAGHNRYFTGRPCKHGHVAERIASNGDCVVCARARLSAWKERYLAPAQPGARAVAKLAGLKRYFTGKPCKSGHIAERFVRDGGCSECKKARYISWYKHNKAHQAKVRGDWAAKNPDLIKLYKKNDTHKRRAPKRAGMSSAALGAWTDRQPKVCHWCGVKCGKNFHVDHYIPLARGGEHLEGNLVIACPSCNLRKGARDPYKFAVQVGRLF